MKKKLFRSGPYADFFSQGVLVDKLLTLAGQVGTDDEGNTAEYLNAIKWSRFGNFAITKWSGSGWIE